MSEKPVTRAEFVRKLCEMVKNQPDIKIFSPKSTENWPKTHNPAQDIKEIGE